MKPKGWLMYFILYYSFLFFFQFCRQIRTNNWFEEFVRNVWVGPKTYWKVVLICGGGGWSWRQLGVTCGISVGHLP